MSQPVEHWAVRLLRLVVLALAAVAGVALAAMLIISCAEVFLRTVFNAPLKGALDLVSVTAAITAAGALPYTSAVKGHVAVEYFFLKLGPRGRIAVDTITRLLMAAFFLLLGWYCIRYGNELYGKGQVSPTLNLPIFWVPYVIALSCVAMVGVKIYHLLHPGKSLIKP